MILLSADIFFKISLFLAVAFSEMIFREYQKCAKQFGSRSGLIWGQIVCKGNQQTTLVSKEFMTTVQV